MMELHKQVGLVLYRNAKYMIWLLPICLVLAYIFLNPFPEVLVSQTVSIRELNSAQKVNIKLAGRALDNYVLVPGQTFSFNKIVGPRTIHQGYTPSPSYRDSDTPLTNGGGICLLSSLLYKNAIELGLLINERTAHTRTTHCVPAGYDATVWYGQNDLRFTNNTKMPLKIAVAVDADQLTVNILGGRNGKDNRESGHLQRIVRQAGDSAIEVTVLRTCGDQLALISRDSYILSRNKETQQIDN